MIFGDVEITIVRGLEHSNHSMEGSAEHWRIDPNENALQNAKFRKEELSGLLESWPLDII